MARCKVLVKQIFLLHCRSFWVSVAYLAGGSPMAAPTVHGGRTTAAQQPAGWHDSGMPSNGSSDAVNDIANTRLAPVVKDLVLSLNEG
jgi:hypothetical protein